MDVEEASGAGIPQIPQRHMAAKTYRHAWDATKVP
jgi:hypothetical protein